MLFILLCILIIVIVTKFRLSRKTLYQQASLFPGPDGLPIVGNLFELSSSDVPQRFKNISKLHNEFGKTVRLWYGSQLYILTIDEKAAENILGDIKLTRRVPVIQKIQKPLVRNGLITSNGERWKRHRKIVTSTFHMKILEQFIDNFAKNSSILTERLLTRADGTPFDPYDYLAKCALDIICETSMGISVNAQLDDDCDYVKHVLHSLERLAERTIKPHLLFDAIYNFTSSAKEQKIASDYIYRFCSNIFKDKLTQFHTSGSTRSESEFIELPVGKKMAFLDLLINHSLLSEDDILDEVTTLIFAGSETAATTCSFAMALLGEHQEAQGKVFEEQKEIFGDDLYRAVTYEDLQKMTYLEQVIKETLRLFPSIPILSRHTEKDIPLDDGRVIPAGSDILIFIYGLHRNPKFFPDPNRFDPSRFSPENCRNRHPYAYLPFGGGRRKCVGYNYAVLETKAILSTVLRQMRLLIIEGEMDSIYNRLSNSVVLRPDGGYCIKLIPREC